MERRRCVRLPQKAAKNLVITMFGDEDDVEPQFKDVDNYYFEEGQDNPVCFSVLPIKFDENDDVAYCGSKELDLRGLADNNLYKVYKKVVAWRVGLDCEQPKISVLSTEGNWIELLKPRKCYEKTVRSILITVQMLHFVGRWPRKYRRSLFGHLYEVFDKFATKPKEDELRKHHLLIKLFAERHSNLMKSKIVRNIIEGTSRKTIQPISMSAGTKERFIVSDSDEWLSSSGDDSDDCSYREDDNSDNSDDGGTDNDGADPLCAMCDDGGELLSCEGQCKRSFHPTEEDGRESCCRTLGFTSAHLKEIGTYICQNCKYNQHQCFKCGELEPSYGPNAKVFQCNKACCGRFYHPKCVAPLLEHGDIDGARKLGKMIAAGMSFTCPVHWCFKCREMEDRTQRALQLAVCRRCPKSYHRECLPSEISFEKKDKDASTLAWELSERIFFYCIDHGIDAAIGPPNGDHMKLPSIPKINKTKDLAKKEVKVTDKRKNNVDQCSTKSNGLSPDGGHMKSPSIPKINRPKDLAKKEIKVTGKRKNNADQCPTKSNGLSPNGCHMKSPSIPKNNKTKDLAKKEVKVTGKRKKNSDQCSTQSTGLSPNGGDMKFPSIPRTNKRKDLVKKEVKVTGKRKKNAGQCSTKSTELPDVFCREESEQTQRIASDSSPEHMVLKPACAAKRLTEDKQFEPSTVKAAANLCSAQRGNEEQLGTLSSFVTGRIPKSTSRVVDSETEKRVISMAEKKTSSGISKDISRKGVTKQISMIKTDGMSECSVQIADKLHWYVQPGDTIVDFRCDTNDFSLLMKEKLEEVGKRCNFKTYDLVQHKNDLCFEERSWMIMQPKDRPHGLNLIMVLDLPPGIQAVLANKLVDKVLTFKPRLIILVVPTKTERLDRKKEPYHLIWEYNHHVIGKPLCQPGAMDVNGETKDGWHVIPPVSLWSCFDRAAENKRIAGSVEKKTFYINQEHNIMLENPSVDKDAKWDNEIFRAGKDDIEREKTSWSVPKKDALHANQQKNDELDSLFVEKHADGDLSNLMSGDEKGTHGGENAYGHDSIAGQEKVTSRRDTRMGGSTYEQDMRSGKENIPRDKRKKLDSSNGGMTPDHVDGLPPKKQMLVAYVEKMTTTNRIGTQQEYGCDGDLEVDGSYACQQEPCIGNLKATEIDTSGDKSRNIRGHLEVTDGKRLDLDRNRKKVDMKKGRDARHEDDRAAYVQVHNGPQCNHKADILDYMFREDDLNSHWHKDDWRQAETSGYKSRERGESNRREESRNNTRENSYRRTSPMWRRNAQKRTRDYSPERRRVDYYENYSRTNNQHRYEKRHGDDYSSDGDYSRQPAFYHANYGTNVQRSAPSYPTRTDYGSDERRSPPSCQRRPDYSIIGRNGPLRCPRRPEQVGYAMGRSTVCSNSRDLKFDDATRYDEYDGYGDFNYEYHAALHTVPAYGPRMDIDERSAVNGRLMSGYGSDYLQRNRFDREPRIRAAGSVTERYAPQLDSTNHQRGQGGFHDDYVRCGGNRTYTTNPSR